ncbi:MAG: hypothetical protein D6796_10160 [Caldilineae bacterium]|nr:MAG: hypothetical protein D6796_10160 [Caldilineae bacterium]
MKNLPTIIQSLKVQLQTCQNNLLYLEEQAAAYGALDVPLRLHNQIAAERRKMETLQAQLAELEKQQTAGGPATETLSPDAPLILIVEEDVYWRDILTGVAVLLGCQSRPVTPRELVARPESLSAGAPRIAVIGLPAEDSFGEDYPLDGWQEAVRKLGQTTSLIFLSTPQAEPVSIATRHYLRTHHIEALATIQKETFNHNWFIKLCQKALV